MVTKEEEGQPEVGEGRRVGKASAPPSLQITEAGETGSLFLPKHVETLC